MGRDHFTSEGRLLSGLLASFFVVTALAAVDVMADLREGTTARHVVVEGGVIFVGLVASSVIAWRLKSILRSAREASGEAEALAERLKVTEAEAERWRTEARTLLSGLGAAIDQQFERWGLSPAEKEVGLLLLKGLSHREIGELREVTEATARQQARAIYRKAGLTGRNDLAAFFLEDLMLPIDPPTPPA